MEKNTLHNEEDYFLSHWLEGELTDEELRQRVSEDDFLKYKMIRDGLNVHSELKAPLKMSFQEIQAKIGQSKVKRKSFGPAKLALAIAASLVLFISLFNSFGSDSTKFETSFSEQKTVTLLDGSSVELNAKSQLSYNESDWNDTREIELIGEAFFKVEKGKTFTVHTKNGEVAVLGTQFNVNSSSDYFVVSCYEGSVKVSIDEKDYVLRPGEFFRRINGNEIEKWTEEANSPSWIVGESSFRSTPLRYVIGALERQYEVEFDRSAIDETAIFTGSFGHNNLDTALASVFRTMQIEYKRNSEKSIVLSHRK